MFLMLPSLALGMATLGFGQAGVPVKVGTIHIQNAIIGTRDGQKAAAELQVKFDPKRKELEKKRGDLEQMQAQLRAGSNTMSDDQKQKLYRDIDVRTKALNRDTEDAQAEFDQEQNKVLQSLGQRIMALITKYSRDNGYAVIFDVSNPQSPVLYVSDTVDITGEIVKIYDTNGPGAAAAPAAPAAAPPAARRPPAAAPARK
ncbi:MAG: OmpH family outer membrane protein [Acidobacteria bacterium]|nr:OmpH family outer membrane protein [Acidobacteriota bacterium]